ncbi:MAG: geranylgeranylglycerol-phosphate geranylgeranyltransferase [Ferruginibacter sp.]
MNTLGAFVKLIRWPNLFFIALTQGLFYFCISRPIFGTDIFLNKMFLLLVLASLFIAAAGYIINDYFDMHIDAINKPSKVVVDKFVKRRWAIVWHILFSFFGLLLSLYVSYKLRQPVIAIGNFLCIVLLWFYSTTFKRKILSGNIIISALTAWVIIILYFFVHKAASALLPGNDEFSSGAKKFYILTLAYSAFAFVVSLVREVIKDLEDMEGDARYKCETMPVKWGVPASKVFIAVWLIVCLAALAAVAVYCWQAGWWPGIIYIALCIMLPILLVMKKLKLAVTSRDYHTLSNHMKAIMLTGILSMLFFLI